MIALAGLGLLAACGYNEPERAQGGAAAGAATGAAAASSVVRSVLSRAA
jgi:hypothetical protein